MSQTTDIRTLSSLRRWGTPSVIWLRFQFLPPLPPWPHPLVNSWTHQWAQHDSLRRVCVRPVNGLIGCFSGTLGGERPRTPKWPPAMEWTYSSHFTGRGQAQGPGRSPGWEGLGPAFLCLLLMLAAGSLSFLGPLAPPTLQG